MKTFVLIVSLWVYKGGSGFTAEFHGEDACEAAAEAVMETHTADRRDSHLSWAICVPKEL